jgi:SAM-dependent methyltransferase
MSQIRDEGRFFAAAIEGARYFNGAIAEATATAGLFEAIQQYSSVVDVCQKMGFHTSKVAVVKNLLDVLVDGGMVERKPHGGSVAYRSRRQEIGRKTRLDGALEQHRTKLDVIEPWQGEHHAQTVRSYMKRVVGEDLSILKNEDRFRFDAKHWDVWQWNLQNPMYDWARVKIVKELATYGGRFLDLACGPGFGAQRLVEFGPPGCEVVGVDKSADFLRVARSTIFPGAKTRFVQQDLNHGLPPLPAGYFDGILFNGAFHFIKDKPALLRQMRTVLRPGGLLVIGHCFSRSGFADESMHDLYFSLIENDCFAEPWERIRSYVSRGGFEELSQFHRGSHSYLLAVRDRNPGEAPDARPKANGGGLVTPNGEPARKD